MYTAAVIGCGRAGFLYDLDPKRKEVFSHIGGYASSKKISKILAADKNKNNLLTVKNKHPEIDVFDSAIELFSQEKVDIVSLATPAEIRLEHINLAIENKARAIFCEKPMSSSIEEAKKIIKACEDSGTILAVNHFRRWDNLHLLMSEMIGSGKIGSIQNILVKYNKGILNTGSHIFDAISMMFGKIKSVRCIGVSKESSEDPTLHIHGKTESGLDFFLIGSDHDHFRLFEIEVLGTKGRIINDNGYEYSLQEIVDSDKNSEFKILSNPDMSTIVGGRTGHYESAVENIISCIEKGGSPLCSGVEGINSLSAAFASIESYRKNGSIELLDNFLI